MKKYVFALLCCLTPSVMMTGFALSIDLSLFKGGLSILDSLFLIAMGLTLIGILFLCIAFLKPEKPLPAEEAEALEEPEEADAMPAAEQADGEADEELEEADMDAEPDRTDASDAQSEPRIGEEAEPSEADTPDEEEIAEAPETGEEAAEDQAVPEPEADAEPEEEKNYPKLTLTGINNSEFKVLPLKDEVTIGRRRTNDLVLADSTISGVHCAITVEDERVYIQDRNSTNGTFLNAKRVFDKTELSKGDVLALGHQEFRIGL